jgi:hypothetical protein
MHTGRVERRRGMNTKGGKRRRTRKNTEWVNKMSFRVLRFCS